MAWTDDCSWLAFSGFEGASFPIICVRRKDGEILWRTTVWALADKAYPIFGFVENVVEVRLVNDNVHVFGHDGRRFCPDHASKGKRQPSATAGHVQ